ncbi:MAG: sugar phosphate isomerase/epimerase, partial [Bacteroidales bacterium]|nr:sugar phosphate isomerase/epimerase [Bacteroidales bacterium]
SCSFSNKKYIGLQIYSVRKAISQDLEGTLTALAEMGYTSIEHAGYSNGLIYGMKPKDFQNLIESLGMKLLSGHVGLSPGGDTNNWEKAIADNAEAGLEYFVVPSMGGMHRDTLEHLKATGEAFNEMGRICKKHGMKFGFHNHSSEFNDLEGKPMYDSLLELTDPKLVAMEMDLYWAVRGGADPVDYFNRYPGRFELWHVKDMEDSEDKFFAEVGYGTIDFERIFAAQKKAGLVYYFVEQDAFRGDPLESVKKSVDYLKMKNF